MQKKFTRFLFCSALALVATFLVSPPEPVHAATITAASCNNTPTQPHVQNAINIAVAGDTVQIPAGTCTWTQTVTLAKSIILRGESEAGTIIVDGLNRSTNVVNINVMTGSGLTEVSHLTFDGNNNDTAGNGGSFFEVSGTGTLWHIGHITYNASGKQRFATVYARKGLMDWLTGTLPYQQGTGAIYVFNGKVGSEPYFDVGWSQPQNLGTDDALYIENSTFNGTAAGAGIPWAIDGWRAARVVFRHNILNDVYLDNHGTESSSRLRGARTFEILDNTFALSSTKVWPEFFDVRSGTGVVRGNTVTVLGSGWLSYFMVLNDLRLNDTFPPWGIADGVNAWDKNDPVTYATGVHSGPNDTNVLTVSPSPGWMPNQWANYHIRNTTQGTSLLIGSNTADTITYSPGYGTVINWKTGDSFAINKVIATLDQPGHGQGDLLVEQSPCTNGWGCPINSVFGVPAWPRAVIEGIYIWNNTFKGNPVSSSNIAAAPAVQEGREWFLTAHPTYIEYTYPHPLATGTTPPADTTPPSAPASLTASVISSTQIDLTWTASTDNVGVTGYRLERCTGSACTSFAQIATPSINSYSDASLTAATTYRYQVRATDAAGNLSGYSAMANATTNAGGGKVITATTCNQADVQNAINAAVDGDTVMIPAGTCTINIPIYVKQ
ncbi:MAG: fibronectin type III domain-containing protein, partial [Patescibacteria group bacterium]